MKGDEPTLLSLARQNDLDEETAYAICRMIDVVGSDIKDDWDWDWLKERRGDYRSLISPSLALSAWRLLKEKDRLSLQTTDDETRRITTVAPLAGMTNLRSLVLQNNEIADLQPLSKMSRLKYLNIYANRVSNPSRLAHLQSLEELNLANNPIESLAVLDQLFKLRSLALSTDQVLCFARCRCLPSIQVLEITGEAPVDNLTNFPEMPLLKVLRVYLLKSTAGIERFVSLSTLELIHGQVSRLDDVEKLKGLTHLKAWTSQPLSLQPLSALYALRRVEIHAPKVDELSALTRLPVMHEIHIGDKADYSRAELAAQCKALTPWGDEFRTSEKKIIPSLNIEMVSQNTFDFYDSKEPFGIKPDECEDGMFKSEREWLVGELRGALRVNFKEDVDGDFLLPGTTGFRRSERLVLYSFRAYESFREIVTAVQHVLCEARNDWIIFFQALVSEGPDAAVLPEEAQDFTVWIYPDKIVAAEYNAAIIRELCG
jgi:Leucine-rich repeat (LRR) protein